MYDSMAFEDFERAMRRSFWRKVRARLTGETNELLPYDLVREDLPYKGQRDIGLQTVPLDRIVGSVGRYRDFDRAFLPIQRQNTSRWVNIRKAHYEDVHLPPVDLYKIGDVYFVKDGNHRVSVARDRNQVDIDAFVTEIEIPFKLTHDMAISEVQLQKALGAFLQQTGLDELRPDADLLLSNPANYVQLHEHINAHRYYLGTELQADVPYDLAVKSWYDNIYSPLADAIKQQGLESEFSALTLADIYLWVSEYQWLLREASLDAMAEEDARETAYDEMSDIYKQREVRQIIRRLRHSTWVDKMIRDREETAFLEKTHIYDIRPQASIVATLPGKYEKILDHIDVHHYYMGLNEQRNVSYEEAVASWYDEVYAPLVEMIREQGILDHFPGRTETDAYIWAIDHREAQEQGEAPPTGTPPWLTGSLYPDQPLTAG